MKIKNSTTLVVPEKANSEPFQDITILPESNSYIDKLDTKRRKFVLLYTKLLGHIGNTCAGIGISRQTYHNWLDADENFAAALMECEMGLNDEVRDILINKAAAGDMTAVIFYLKKRHPDFKDRPPVLIQQNFGEKAKAETEEFTDE